MLNEDDEVKNKRQWVNSLGTFHRVKCFTRLKKVRKSKVLSFLRIQNCFVSVSITLLAVRVTYKGMGLVSMLVRTEEITDTAMEAFTTACPAGRFLGVCWHQKGQKRERGEQLHRLHYQGCSAIFCFKLLEHCWDAVMGAYIHTHACAGHWRARTQWFSFLELIIHKDC